MAQAVPLKGCAWLPLIILFLEMFGPFQFHSLPGGGTSDRQHYMGVFVWMLSPGQKKHDSQ